MRLMAMLLVVMACAKRVEPSAPGPSPLCASRYEVRHDVIDDLLVVSGTSSAPCSERKTGTLDLAQVPIEPKATCPFAGRMVLEVGSSERPLPFDYAATLDARTTAGLTRALRSLLSTGMTSAKALVVRCSTPKWLLVATHRAPPASDLEPRTMLFEVAPEEAPTTWEAPPPEQPLVTGHCDESLDAGTSIWIGRRLSTGMLPGPSHFETWTLGRTKDRATLVVQEFDAPRTGPPADVQPQGEFRCRRSESWEGTVTGTQRLELNLLQPPRGPARTLVCTPRTITVAQSTARRVRVRSTEEGCNASRWTAPPAQRRQVLACAEGSGTPFLLGASPGVEHLTFDNDDCGDPARAMRLVPANGTIEPAVKLSEQPPEFVPRQLR